MKRYDLKWFVILIVTFCFEALYPAPAYFQLPGIKTVKAMPEQNSSFLMLGPVVFTYEVQMANECFFKKYYIRTNN